MCNFIHQLSFYWLHFAYKYTFHFSCSFKTSASQSECVSLFVCMCKCHWQCQWRDRQTWHLPLRVLQLASIQACLSYFNVFMHLHVSMYACVCVLFLTISIHIFCIHYLVCITELSQILLIFRCSNLAFWVCCEDI